MCLVFGMLGTNWGKGWNSIKVSWVVCIANQCGMKCSWDSFGWDKVPTCVGAPKGIGKLVGNLWAKLGHLKNSWLGCLGFHSFLYTLFLGEILVWWGSQLPMRRPVGSWKETTKCWFLKVHRIHSIENC